MAATAAGAPDLARPSGSSAISTTTIPAQASIGGDREAPTISSCASANGRRRTRSGSGSISRPRCSFARACRPTTKESRAVVLSLALSELLARAGERVGVLGSRPYTGRNAARRVAEVLVGDAGKATSLPPPATLSRFSECLLFSDFLEPVEETAARIEAIAAQGVRGHLVQILDPAEETLPYEGRTEFSASEGRRPRDRRTRRKFARTLSGAADKPPQRACRRGKALELVVPSPPYRQAGRGGRARHPQSPGWP